MEGFVMSEKKREKESGILKYIGEDYRNRKPVFVTYVVLRLLVIAVMFTQFQNKAYDSVFLCLLTLFLFTLPSVIERRLRIELPGTLEIIILLFIFCAEILGEIREYYLIYPFWDTMLHTANGFLSAAIGIAMIDVLNRSDKIKFNMSPIFVAVVAFCFSMTIGVLWEFFEFGMDTFFHTDMQKDTVLQTISSFYLNHGGKNAPAVIRVYSESINGVDLGLNGYLDIGLFDTMKDLLVNFVGALVFSTFGYFYIKNRGKGSFAKRFIPTRKKDSSGGVGESSKNRVGTKSS